MPGPGVGKSVLLGMILRHTCADVIVVVFDRERGREVKDFIRQNILVPKGVHAPWRSRRSGGCFSFLLRMQGVLPMPRALPKIFAIVVSMCC
ncbi:hypothetical protein ACNKHV_12215 [Shigella flexneri]